MAPHEAVYRALVPVGSRLSSLSSRALGRSHPRWEPDAVTPLVRICGGGQERSWSLLRLLVRLFLVPTRQNLPCAVVSYNSHSMVIRYNHFQNETRSC